MLLDISMAIDLLTRVHSLHERLDETLTTNRNNDETLKLLVHKSWFNVLSQVLLINFSSKLVLN
jgi:hypothetical protein